MSKIQGILRSLYSFNLSPSELFIKANHILKKDIKKQYFIMAIAGLFDIKQKNLSIARAGHLPLFHYKSNEKIVDQLIPSGIGFGLGSSEIFTKNIEQLNIPYCPGDIFVFATDGLTEAFDDNGNEFGEEQLTQCLIKNVDSSAGIICQSLIENVKTFAGNTSQHDDMTVVVVKIQPNFS